ncbi:MAG: hypothetical protein OEV78_10775 [Spirochaetia bacterium]|nr:hypothetical protein [Spirochaetia bacterium]
MITFYSDTLKAESIQKGKSNSIKNNEKLKYQYADIKPATEIDIEFSLVKIETIGIKICYEYKLYSKATSIQNIYSLDILVSNKSNFVSETNYPNGWSSSTFNNLVGWGSNDLKYNLKPGNSLYGFQVVSSGLPGIITYQAQGWVDPPWYPEGMAPPLPPGYDPKKDYVFGKTVGPVPVPNSYSHKKFINNLIVMLVQMTDELHWIDRNKVDTLRWVNHLKEARDNIKWWKSNKQAIQNIQAFINEVDAQKGKHMDLESWAVLKFNAEYLMRQL